MLDRVLLISGGNINLEFAVSFLENNSFDTVVCADSGLDAAYQLHLPVQYFMGDFDSVCPDILERYRNGEVIGSEGASWIRYPAEKDYIDTQLVLEWILERGASEIVILGATGGRLDHFMANVNLLMLPLKQNIPAVIVDEQNRIRLIDRDFVLRREEVFGKYVSLQPLTNRVTGVTLEGLKYPLHDYTLAVGTARAVSNELAPDAREAVIHLREGVLIVTESRES